MRTGGRRGRPRLREDAGKRFTLGLRVTEERRKQLEQAASVAGRSLSAELELRIEQSFWTEEIFGGRELLALFREMASAALLVQSQIPHRRADKTWLTDINIYMKTREAWIAILDRLAPLPPDAGIELFRGSSGLLDILLRKRKRTQPKPARRQRRSKKP